jgi:hypothetical protein
MSIVIFFSHNPIFTGAAWANAMPEDPANAAINTNERLNSPQHLFRRCRTIWQASTSVCC